MVCCIYITMNDCKVEEKNLDHEREEELVDDYVKIVKVAVAVAVIQNKPEGSSAYEYSRQLCGRYQKMQLDWKVRNEKLEEELLFIKQQLLLKKLPVPSPDSSPVQEYAQRLDLCNSYGNDVSSPSGDSESGSSDSGNSVEKSSGMGVNDCKPSKSAIFVSNIVTLRSMAKAGFSDRSEWNETIVDTTLQSMRSIVGYFASDIYLNTSPTILQTAVDSFVDLIDGNILPHQAHRALLEIGAEFLHVLTTKVVVNRDLNSSLQQRRMCQYIMSLGQSDRLKQGVVRYLVQTILTYTDELRTTIKFPKQRCQEPNVAENMYYVFWCLEQLLSHELNSPSRVTLITTDLALQLGNYLDDAVMHISEIYPMFVHYIWHVNDLIHRLGQQSL